MTHTIGRVSGVEITGAFSTSSTVQRSCFCAQRLWKALS